MMHIRNILVPVDFGEASADALDLAVRIAAKLGAKLTLLHAFNVPPLAYSYDPTPWVADLSTASRAELAALIATTKRRHLDTESLWMEGDPRACIIDAARDRSADLIVAGTHGRQGVTKVLFGSVAERLVRTSPVPLITTKAGAARVGFGPRIRHLMVATDFGEPSQRARSLACALARSFDARVTLVHVVPWLSAAVARVLPAEAEMVAQAKLALKVELELAKQEAPAIDSLLVEGDPRERILSAARELDADVIAMGTHARQGLSRIFMGSVAEALVRTSEIPVLTTSADAEEAKSAAEAWLA
jgi:nucleotide-binding universal stress UspA family protein